MAILLIIFTVINWVIYHKIFTVYYLGGASKSIIYEIFWSMIGACVEVAILMHVGKNVLGIIFTIAFAIGIFLAIKSMYKDIIEPIMNTFRKKNTEEASENNEKVDLTETDMNSETMSEEVTDNGFEKGKVVE